MVAYIVNMLIIWDADLEYRPFVGGGEGGIPRYILQPGYIADLIYGPRGQRYNGFPLYIVYFFQIINSLHWLPWEKWDQCFQCFDSVFKKKFFEKKKPTSDWLNCFMVDK